MTWRTLGLTLKDVGKPLTVIFSLDRVNDPACDAQKAQALAYLNYQGITNIRPALGVFEGKSEASFIAVVPYGEGKLAEIIAVCRDYDQKFILVVDEKNRAALVGCNFERQERIIGIWRKTNRIHKDAMTIDLTDMQGYVVKPLKAG